MDSITGLTEKLYLACTLDGQIVRVPEHVVCRMELLPAQTLATPASLRPSALRRRRVASQLQLR